MSNWRAEQSISDYLAAQNVVAIAEIDTRRLTRLLRQKGALRGAIVAGESSRADHAREAGRRIRHRLH